MSDDDSDHVRRAGLVLSLRARGITNRAILSAIERVPRDHFVDEDWRGEAHRDTALPIACGQVTLAPLTVARMIGALDLNDRHRVLLIGAGTGYVAAILAHLTRRVIALERYRMLADLARANLAALHIGNAEVVVADGLKGWPSSAPFDRILVTGSVADMPQALLMQLSDTGVIVVAVGPDEGEQSLRRLTRVEEGWHSEPLMPVRFVPLVEGLAKAL